jgi:hypothetical protein
MKYTKYITVETFPDSDMDYEIIDYISNAKAKDFKLTVEPIKSKRSDAQNRLYWLLVRAITETAQGWGSGDFDGWDAEHDMHPALSEKYLRVKNEKTGRMMTRSTTSLTVEEFNVYIDKLINVLCNVFGGSFDEKHKELYKVAMGEKGANI